MPIFQAAGLYLLAFLVFSFLPFGAGFFQIASADNGLDTLIIEKSIRSNLSKCANIRFSYERTLYRIPPNEENVLKKNPNEEFLVARKRILCELEQMQNRYSASLSAAAAQISELKTKNPESFIKYYADFQAEQMSLMKLSEFRQKTNSRIEEASARAIPLVEEFELEVIQSLNPHWINCLSFTHAFRLAVAARGSEIKTQTNKEVKESLIHQIEKDYSLSAFSIEQAIQKIECLGPLNDSDKKIRDLLNAQTEKIKESAEIALGVRLEKTRQPATRSSKIIE